MSWNKAGIGMRVSVAGICTCVISLLLLAGCSINPRGPEHVPKIAGNTFDLQNDLAVILPAAERINVSYEYILADDAEDYIDAPGFVAGPLWWYEERSSADPEQFLGIQLAVRAPEFEEPEGTTLRLSKTRYNVQTYCIDLSAGEPPPILAPFLESFMALERPVWTDVYIRRFVLAEEREGRQRTDLIFVRDIVRLGYTCELLGDLSAPTAETEDILRFLSSQSEAAFEVMS